MSNKRIRRIYAEMEMHAMKFDHCFHCMGTAETYPCPHCGYDPQRETVQTYALRPGTILNGKYVVGTVMGQGGFGITYVGWDLALDCKVAIKEYYPSGQVARDVTASTQLQWYTTPQSEAARNNGRELFLKEARKMTRVRDIPQVVHVHDLFQENDTAYIAMDYVEGQTLKVLLMEQGPLPWERAKTIFLPAIQAMEEVHEAGLIHRDLSPDNLMITPGNKVRILDLGASKDLKLNSGASSMQVAKGGFSPLEQYTQRGGSGSWSDVYAMAATMYYALTGVVPPFSVDRMEEDQIRWDLEPLQALPAPVLEAIRNAMGVFAKKRTQTMAEFLAQLEGAAAPVEKEPEPRKQEKTEDKTVRSPQKSRKSGKKLWYIPVVALVLVAALAAGWFLLPGGWRSLPGLGEEAPALSEPPVAEPIRKTLAVGVDHLAILEKDGTVTTQGSDKYGQCNVSDWADMVDIDAGYYHTVGLKKDGTVVSVGQNKAGECEVSGWTDIVDIAAMAYGTAALRADGTVVAVGDNTHRACDVSQWQEIAAISGGVNHMVGLKRDGTVVAAGSDGFGQCDLSQWQNITEVAAGDRHTIGLKADGTVVAAGQTYMRYCNVSDWTDIVSVAAGSAHTAGLRSDGTVVAVGSDNFGQCQVSTWENIVAIGANLEYTVGLRSDGSLVYAGKLPGAEDVVAPEEAHDAVEAPPASDETPAQEADTPKALPEKTLAVGDYHSLGLLEDGTIIATGNNQSGQCNVSEWRDIIAISAGLDHTVGLRSDGTVLAIGNNGAGRCQVSSWKDIIDVSAGMNHTIGAQANGRAVATGNNVYGQCEVSYWNDIVAVSAGENHSAGLRSDGTVVAVGYNDVGQCNVFDWTDIVAISAGGCHTIGLKADGTVVAAGYQVSGRCDVKGWSDIIAVSAGKNHTVGVRSDGTVVAVGDNQFGQCNVSRWRNIVAVSAGNGYTLGLTASGTVVAAGNSYLYEGWDISDWCDLRLPDPVR